MADMFDNITSRQLQILEATINEFLGEENIEIASSYIVDRYDLDACPATVRTEMAFLEKLGYLIKPHISSGRIPSSIGIKYYLSNLLKETEISNTVKESIKAKISAKADDLYSMLTEAVTVTTRLTDELVIANIDGFLIRRNTYRIMKYPEIMDTSVIASILHLSENPKHILKLTKNVSDDVFVIIGEDINYDSAKNLAIIGKLFTGLNNSQGLISIISSKRINYPKVIPIIRYITDVIQSSISKWAW